MEWLAYVIALGVFVVGAGSVFLVAVGMPGTWLLLALAAGIELADGLWLPPERSTTFSWWTLAACLALAILGEILEAGAGAVGAKRAGASRRGVIAAVIGGIVGAIAGAPFGFVVGSFAGAAIGTFLGALVAELTRPGAKPSASLRPAWGATVGRILGTLSKIPVAIAVWITLTFAAFVR